MPSQVDPCAANGPTPYPLHWSHFGTELSSLLRGKRVSLASLKIGWQALLVPLGFAASRFKAACLEHTGDSLSCVGPGVGLKVAGLRTTVVAPVPDACVRLLPCVGRGVSLEVAGC